MDAQRYDPKMKTRLSPLVIPQVAGVGSMGANHEERQYAFLSVPPPTPRTVRPKKSCDAERVRHSKQKATVASARTSPTLASPTFGGVRLVTTTETTLPESVAFELPSPPPQDEYYYLTSSSRRNSGYDTSPSSGMSSPIDDHVDRQIIRPQRSRVGLRKSLGNLRKSRSAANLPKMRMPGTATFGVPTPISSDDSLPSTTSSAGSGLKSPRSHSRSRRPSLAALPSPPVALNEVTDTLRRLKSRLNLRDASTERGKWKFDEAVEYYERAWARAESGDRAIEVCVEHTCETVADPAPKEHQYPDGIGLYARPRSRKNTMPVSAVAEGPRQVLL